MLPILPTAYVDFIQSNGVFEGFVKGEDGPGYVELWKISDIPNNNSDIEIEKYAPGFIAFAGNGGGELLAFDSLGAVYMLPLVGMSADYAKHVSDSFLEFATLIDRYRPIADVQLSLLIAGRKKLV